MPNWSHEGVRSDRFVARHADLDEFGVQSAAALAANADFGCARRLAVPGRVTGVPCHDSDEEEDPPEADEPSPDASEDATDHEQDDRAHEGAEDVQHAAAPERRADRTGDEAEEGVKDDHDADDREESADEQDRDSAPAEGQGGRVSPGGDRRISEGDRHEDGVPRMPGPSRLRRRSLIK